MSSDTIITMQEAIARVKEDPVLAGAISEKLRLKGFSYRAIYEYVNHRNPMELREWDALLRESEARTT